MRALQLGSQQGANGSTWLEQSLRQIERASHEPTPAVQVSLDAIEGLDATNAQEAIAELKTELDAVNPVYLDEIVIASGAITLLQSSVDDDFFKVAVYKIQVDTEGLAATDNLDTITGGQDGSILILRSENSSRDVTIRDTVGNIELAHDENFTLRGNSDTLLLYNENGTSWRELARSRNNTGTSGSGGKFLGFHTTAPTALNVDDQYCDLDDGHIFEWDGSAWNDTGRWVTVF